MNIEQFKKIFISSLKGPKELADFLELYDDNCIFSDPFHTIKGKVGLETLYRNAFKHLINPRFLNVQTYMKNKLLCVSWELNFKRKGIDHNYLIPGVSWIELNQANLICVHKDYWDSLALFSNPSLIRSVVRFFKNYVAKLQLK